MRPLIISSGLLIGLALIAAQPAKGQPADACGKCPDVSAEWSWKANGYAVGKSPAEAEQQAREQAVGFACKEAHKWLAPRKLACRRSCKAGETTKSCAPSKKPLCKTGSHEKDPGMWKFVCLKAKGKPGACTKEAAEQEPSYGMCDASVTGKKTLACRHPDCDQES